jgi:NADH dehydrogenase FAD-containing subunit
MPYSGGLKRNIVQCLDDYDIPLYFNTTVSEIVGKDRVEGVYLSKVDENMRVIPGTEKYYECDTLLLSVGLIPENELSKSAGIDLDRKTKGSVVSDRLMTSVDGIFACGNVLHVHDLVDYVSEEAEMAAANAAEYIKGDLKESETKRVQIKAGEGISYVMPQYLHYDTMPGKLTLRFRVNGVYQKSAVKLYADGEEVKIRRKRIFAPGEMENFILLKGELDPDVSEIEIKLEEI